MADQMKSSKNSNIAIIVGITLLCFALWRFFDKPILNEAAGSSAPKNQISAAERLEDAVKNVKEEIQARGNARDFEKALQKEILSLNQPMDFYGKVVDHLGRGIADATIVYTWDVQQAAPWVPTKASSDRIQSQPDGTFEIHLKAVRWITIYKSPATDTYVHMVEIELGEITRKKQTPHSTPQIQKNRSCFI